MIKNFEEVTNELNPIELSIIPIMVAGFNRHKKNDPIKAPDIVKNMNIHLKCKGIKLTMTEARLRKCCNHIRKNSIIPLIATSKGYYVSNDPQEISDQIQSLMQRANSIQECAQGMAKFLEKK